MKMKLSVLALALGSMLATGAIIAAPVVQHDAGSEDVLWNDRWR